MNTHRVLTIEGNKEEPKLYLFVRPLSEHQKRYPI